MMLAALTIICSSLVVTSRAANILALVPSNSYSHFTVVEPLLKELASRGHHLTVVNSFPQKQPVANYEDIDVASFQRTAQSNLDFQLCLDFGRDVFSNIATIWSFGTNFCESFVQYKPMKDLYNSTKHFDLVIAQLFSHECVHAFAHKFNTPIVSVVTSSALPWSNPRVGNPDHPAYIVNNYINAHEDMTLYQRIMNVLGWIWSYFAICPLGFNRMDDLIYKYLDPTVPPLAEIMKRTSLVLVNSHFTILQARPLVPNFIEIGGIHIKDPKPLPKDLQSYLDSAPQGAIVFSLGSLVRTSTMGNTTLQALMDAFRSLPQRFVFKYEEDVENPPPNVLIRKWLPQRDLLEHPNVKVLMAHGGQSSTIEAVYTGTPLIGMPLFSDQYSNIQTLVLKEAAVLLDIRSLTKEHILNALNKVINDPRYTTNAELLSRQFRDRLVSPLETAVYWTEYVLRHKGAPQLRSKSADLPWYRFLLLDVASVLLFLTVTSYYVIKFLLKSLLQCLLTVISIRKKPKRD